MNPILVTTTVASKADAEKIATALLEEKLAACVQVSDAVNSYYRWEGEVKNDLEFVCTIKTESSLFDEVARVIEKIHPYEIPQIIAVPVVHGSINYLSWCNEQIVELARKT